ncbi:MAG TPA: enoyl-CoA hydratase [Candidatus Baltobacteraceae bacterium]|nr:enoyl-CoA hydratase [Candidatus Baltobacteraceae bacterium]
MIQLNEVNLEREGATAIVTMRRPERRNALSLAMMRELQRVLDEIGQDREVRAVILAGEGPAFSAGHDLRELQGRDRAAYVEIFDQCIALMATLAAIPQPVIAEVGAMATAAGCQLVAACDLAVASEAARFATPGVRIGLFCSTPMVALSRAVGRKRALQMLLTGEPIDAPTALAWGLVNEVVPADGLRAATLALAAKIAAASRTVVRLGKEAFYRQIELDVNEAYAFAKQVMVDNAQLDDAQEGITAFIHKRSPRWQS